MKKTKKEIVSYYDMGGDVEKMYKALDDFLVITKKVDENHIKNVKKWGSLIAFGAAALLIAAAVYDGSLEVVILCASLAFLSAGLGVYLLTGYGAKEYPNAKRVNALIDADGMQELYDDLQRSQPIPGTSAYTGGKYLFLRGDAVMRIDDIKRFFIYEKEGDDRHAEYHVAVEIEDEAGKSHFLLKEVFGTKEERKAQMIPIRESIMTERNRYLKLEDKVEI